MTVIRKWITISLIYFVLIAMAGVLLRALLTGDLSGAWLNYKYLLHTHSHIAFIGWIYNALLIAVYVMFLRNRKELVRKYRNYFWVTQLVILGMLFSFPFQGYGTVSIIFSSVFILFTYWLAWNFFKDQRKDLRYSISQKSIKAALVFLVVSSLGIWALAPIMALGYKGSDYYYLAVYFYLHFQYNGWFTFAILGCFSWMLENSGLDDPGKKALKRIYYLLLIACVPAYLQSVLYLQPPGYVYLLSSAATFLQLIATYLLIRLIITKRKVVTTLRSWTRILLQVALIAFIIKVVLQFVSSLPWLNDAFFVRNLVIAYLHLVLLGFVSAFLLGFFIHIKQLRISNVWSKAGMALFITGFITMELILAVIGIMQWRAVVPPAYLNQLLLIASLFLPFSLLLILFSQIRQKYDQHHNFEDVNE